MFSYPKTWGYKGNNLKEGYSSKTSPKLYSNMKTQEISSGKKEKRKNNDNNNNKQINVLLE